MLFHSYRTHKAEKPHFLLKISRNELIRAYHSLDIAR